MITPGLDDGRLGKLFTLTSPVNDTVLVILLKVNKLLSWEKEVTAELELCRFPLLLLLTLYGEAITVSQDKN